MNDYLKSRYLGITPEGEKEAFEKNITELNGDLGTSHQRYRRNISYGCSKFRDMFFQANSLSGKSESCLFFAMIKELVLHNDRESVAINKAGGVWQGMVEIFVSPNCLENSYNETLEKLMDDISKNTQDAADNVCKLCKMITDLRTAAQR
ncbi:MAG: hypothetical protein LBG89_01440 [Rickettsiales bacterium]|jgi:hypothetical protein|nr:hypothetical protein [Rickettsiales bacterium]